MQGVRSRVEPKPATDCSFSVSDEISILELHLQKQLEEDIARIFDESIYSDVEVVCGKLKVLTHSCILKTRTKKFYRKLETILQLNIERSTFDEIYSFISDAYTECNINYQESEIITYLNGNLTVKKANTKDTGEPEEFSTPKCVSPYVEKDFFKPISSSPSTELTKEYYALVPIDGNILEKELIEQDVLLNAFHSIKKSQIHTLNKTHSDDPPCVKPTTLHLVINERKTLEHSTSCDIVNSYQLESNDKVSDVNFSPDSLITDEPSSSSDYLSAAHTFSPGVISSGCFVQLNNDDCTVKKDIIFTSSDSGLLESDTSHIDITMADLSLNDQDLVTSNSHDTKSVSSQNKELFKNNSNMAPATDLSNIPTENDVNGAKNHRITESASKSSKEEKQRQNEEIVILESSSLSSETGSWESVFPPRVSERDVCEQFISHEREHLCDCKSIETKIASVSTQTSSLVQKSPYKTTSCFIDAASLADEENDTMIVINETQNVETAPVFVENDSSRKQDLSPIEWSEGNDNDDSLEQPDNENVNSVAQNLSSPLIHEINKIRDSLDEKREHGNIANSKISKTKFFTSTPNNSLKVLKLDSDDDAPANLPDLKKLTKYTETAPILSGGASVDDHLPVSTYSPLGRRKSENVPIISGAFTPTPEKKCSNKSPKPSCAETWTVDMTSTIENKNKEIDNQKSVEKKNIFSMFIDLGEKSNIKQMPARLTASLNTKKINHVEQKNSFKSNTTNESRETDVGDVINTRVDTSDVSQITIDTSDFEKYETLCENPNISVSDIIALPKKKLVVMSKQSTEHTSTGDEQPRNNITPLSQVKKINDGNVVDQDLKKVNSQECSIREHATHSEFTRWEENANAERGKTVPHKRDTQKETNVPKENFINCKNHIQEDMSPSGLFVKLSDLDKPSQKIETAIKNNCERVMDMRMTRSIPENNWGGQHHNVAPISMDVISSFHSENALSLNRLFPHLQNEFSRSMPGSLSSRTRSPLRQGYSSSTGDADEQASDMSEMSSVQSSACRSVIGFTTTEDSSKTSSIIYNCQSRLGQDLLRMFLEEIAPDVIVEVSGRRIRAHKCILSSRCQYFAGILSGGWVESAGNVILLPPFAYNVVHFALCHIYSGTSSIPDSISIVELTTLADMLGLEGLKEAITFNLKSKYCHNFHRPCPVCIAGVLECFPLSALCGLDDLYHKCLRWITKFFSKVWPTKAFATLPADLLERCYQQHVVHFTIETLPDTVTGAGIALMAMNMSGRDCDPVEHMCRRLINAAAQFASSQVVEVMRTIATLPNDMPPCALRALDDCIMTAINCAPPDEICRAYAYTFSVFREMRIQHQTKPDLLSNSTQNIKAPGEDTIIYTRVTSWMRQCEEVLVQSAPRVVGLQAYMDLPPELRQRLRDMGCIIYGSPAVPRMSQSELRRRSASAQKNRSELRTHNIDIDRMRASFVPYSPKPTTSGDVLKTYTELRKSQNRKEKNSVPTVKMTKAQEERAKYNLAKHALNQDRSACNKIPDKNSANANSRYQAERVIRKGVNTKMDPAKLYRMKSSSESSTSTIGMRANLKSRHINDMKGEAMSQDSLATSSRPRTAEPSTDSLSESQASNKYATYTKTKHTIKGSVESVQTSKSRVPVQPHLTNKGITKIPILKNTGTRPNQVENKSNLNGAKKNSHTGTTSSISSSSAQRQTAPPTKADRKAPKSLMSATKSSSAKVVQRIVKEPSPPKVSNRRTKVTAKTSSEKLPDVPAMDRSGTFLKDEPTFGDKTTNFDIDD